MLVQENMNESGTRKSDTNTPIANYILLNRNTCSGNHLCIGVYLCLNKQKMH